MLEGRVGRLHKVGVHVSLLRHAYHALPLHYLLWLRHVWLPLDGSITSRRTYQKGRQYPLRLRHVYLLCASQGVSRHARGLHRLLLLCDIGLLWSIRVHRRGSCHHGRVQLPREVVVSYCRFCVRNCEVRKGELIQRRVLSVEVREALGRYSGLAGGSV
jgi:hypothetical protein